MTNNLAKIRAALEAAKTTARVCVLPGLAQETDEALATLAELERASKEPVAWVWNDELGIPHASAGPKKPVWLESSASAEYIRQANLRPLYTTPPAPVAEIREPTPEECADMAEWFKSECLACCINSQESADYGRAIFDAVKIVMWPKEGL